MKVLYSATEIQRKLHYLLGADAECRRVLAVAYIGVDGPDLVAPAAGIEFICSPTPGSTSPAAVRRLISQGGQVTFCPNLHMKVYWSETQGCIIGSANMTRNGLYGKLEEAGVLLPPGAVDIDKLIGDLNTVAADEDAIVDLERATDIAASKDGTGPSRALQLTFAEWFKATSRKPWRIGWFDWEYERAAVDTLNRCNLEYRRPEPYTWLNVAENQVIKGEWLLCMNTANSTIPPTSIKWLFVDFLGNVTEEADGELYEPDAPRQAVMVRSPKFSPTPPFTLSADTKRAFAEAFSEYGLKKIKRDRSLVPPSAVLQLVCERLS